MIEIERKPMREPEFPVGTKVLSHLFHDPDKPKTVYLATWDGAEYAYVLIDDKGIYDEGYFVHHLKKAVNKHRITKPDPLVEAMAECGVDPFESWADQLRAALAKRGGRIVFDD